MNVLLILRVPIALASLALAACGSVAPAPTPTSSPVPPPAWGGLDAASVPRLTAEPPSDLAQWWRGLGDPLLGELVDEALRANPDVRIAQARVREARARRTVAESALYPSVDARSNARRSSGSEETGSGATFTVYGIGLDASWEIDVFGGLRRGVDAAAADVAAAAANLDAVRATLAAEVALNYVQLRTLQARRSVALASLATQTETLQLVRWRAEAGLVSTQDVEQARSSLEQTRALIPALELALAESGHRLDGLLGRPPGSLQARLAAPSALPPVPLSIATGIPADTLRQRPDVRAAEQRLAAEQARVGVAEAARFPSLQLTGSIGLEALTLGALGQGSAATSSILAGVVVPIFNAGRLRARVEQQDAVREQAQLAYEQTVLNALQEVENALQALKRNHERERALGEAVEANRNAAALALQRYSAGLIDFQSVLDTERTRLLVEENRVAAQSETVLALIRLYKALGGGWAPMPDATGKDPA